MFQNAWIIQHEQGLEDKKDKNNAIEYIMYKTERCPHDWFQETIRPGECRSLDDKKDCEYAGDFRECWILALRMWKEGVIK